MFSFLFNWNSSPIKWLPSAGGDSPSNALIAGSDVDGRNIYVARAKYQSGLIPGKLINGFALHCACIGYDLKEMGVAEYEVLATPADAVKWVRSESGSVPSNAVFGGYDPNGDLYYVGRVAHEGSLTPGKVHQKNGYIYIPFGGKEYWYSSYEVLVSTGNTVTDVTTDSP